MASEVLRSEIDIHSGGEDLRFPHRGNEVSITYLRTWKAVADRTI